MSKNILKKRLTSLEQRVSPGPDKIIVIKMWQPDNSPIESGSRKTRIVRLSEEEATEWHHKNGEESKL